MNEGGHSRNMSEWLKVLLEEIERRKRESELAREERRRRAEERDSPQEK